jgi:peptide-methionine (S)-S-oxide reductase
MIRPLSQLQRLGLLFALLWISGVKAGETKDHATAIFAGGCFWCIEADFEKLPGVIAVESGYTGGHAPEPDYQSISRGDTGHAEAVRVYYDPTRVDYPALLDFFWRHIDPTVENRQFCDVGPQYRSAIFYAGDSQREAALASRDELLRSGRFARIHTEIIAASRFYPAEEYHQDYYLKNPLRYAWYRKGCGRDERVRQLWGASAGGD